MKSTVPDDLNRFRLREGAMATDDDANYEGAFLVPSPFDARATLQIMSSELPPPGSDCVCTERVSTIVKVRTPGRLGGITERSPTIAELRYVRSLFFEDKEVPVIPLPHPDFSPTHPKNAMLLHRPGGFTELPPAYLEEVEPRHSDGAPTPPEQAVNVVEFCQGLQKDAAAREASEREASASRRLDDVKRLINGLNWRPDSKGNTKLVLSAEQFARLASLLRLT